MDPSYSEDDDSEREINTDDSEMSEKMKRARYQGESKEIQEDKDELLGVFEEVKG